MITVVTGMARSGSSMMMQMLAAGGMEIYAESPTSGEHSDVLRLPKETAFLEQCEGKAIKVLDVHRNRLPRTHDYCFIWTQRNSIEQAKSHQKMLGLLMNRTFTWAETKGLAKALDIDTPRVQDFLRRQYGAHVLVIQFEDVLAAPAIYAGEVAEFIRERAFVAGGIDAVPRLDLDRMAAVVLPRSRKCLPNLLEDQIAERLERGSLTAELTDPQMRAAFAGEVQAAADQQ